MLVTWPTDPPGKAPSHSVSYSSHLADVAAQQRAASINGVNAAQATSAAQVKAAQAPAGPQKGIYYPETTDANGVTTLAPPPAAAPVFAPDGAYNDAIALAQKNYTDSIAQLEQQKTQTQYDYGFDDTTNPFSEVNNLKKQYTQQGQYITNSLGAAGQGNSGAYGAEQLNSATNHDKATAALRAAYTTALNNIGNQETTAGNTQTASKLAAYQAAMARQGIT